MCNLMFDVLLLVLLLLFFFFKQKTAYEMRISDWSSDVCSSDLKPGYCWYGANPHEAWFDPRDGIAKNFCARRQPLALCLVQGGDYHCSGPVIDAARVASGHRAIGTGHRFEFRKRRLAGRPWLLVGNKRLGFAAIHYRPRHGDNLAGEAARFNCVIGSMLATKCEGVLIDP